MSNWKFLNENRCSKSSTVVPMHYLSTPEDGFNGMFRFNLEGRMIRCIASDGEGWQHVSVSIEYETRTPNWQIMCAVKDLFWDPEDWVCQFHPARSQYVNHHPGCLHLWRCTDGRVMPTPPFYLVGPKAK